MAEPARALEVTAVGPQVTVQDLGRPGQAHLGVPRSGALDEPAHRLANRLVGNPESAATLECLGGRLAFRSRTAVTVAVTGAQLPVRVDGRGRDWGHAVAVPAGATVELGDVTRGLRAYLAVSGGLDVEPVLGSRATDLLSGLGPEPVSDGDVLPVGTPTGDPVPVDAEAPVRVGRELRVRLGPREDWFEERSVRALDRATYVVGNRSNRIGLRLEGERIRWRDQEELSSEGMVLGAVQVPPNGQPVVFLHDHPTTGGYPVVGVVVPEDLAACAQLRPGEEVTLRVVGTAPVPRR
ncbi:MAG: biotin-dependent carboxyltransferase family protein [Marmoricola sp.]